MVGCAMPTTAKSDDRHFGRDGSLYAHRAVFDDDAVPAPGAELPGCEQEEVGSRLPLPNLRGAEDVRVKKRQQPGHRKRMADPIEMAVRGDAARHRQHREQLLDAGYRDQLLLECDIDMSAEFFEEFLRQ